MELEVLDKEALMVECGISPSSAHILAIHKCGKVCGFHANYLALWAMMCGVMP